MPGLDVSGTVKGVVLGFATVAAAMGREAVELGAVQRLKGVFVSRMILRGRNRAGNYTQLHEADFHQTADGPRLIRRGDHDFFCICFAGRDCLRHRETKPFHAYRQHYFSTFFPRPPRDTKKPQPVKAGVYGKQARIAYSIGLFCPMPKCLSTSEIKSLSGCPSHDFRARASNVLLSNSPHSSITLRITASARISAAGVTP